MAFKGYSDILFLGPQRPPNPLSCCPLLTLYHEFSYKEIIDENGVSYILKRLTNRHVVNT